jgi:pimeloyl-ACP methyl ester carboxylesterase
MIPVYCISGLGADERVFSKLQLTGCEIHYIKWVQPDKNETIESYAARLCKQVAHKEPVLIGVSFGGMVAVEIAKLISCKKIFLVSSIKNSSAIPLWINLAGKSRLNKIIPLKRKGGFFISIENYFLGPETEQEKWLVNEFRQSVDKYFLYWSVNQILNWRNQVIHPNIIHLLGDKDKFFSVKKAKPDYIIRNGTHFMIYNRASEVSKLIQQHL